MNRRWTAIVVASLAAIIGAPIVLLLAARPAEAPGSTPAASPASTIAASASDVPSGRGITFTVAKWPEDAAWYRIGRDLGRFPQHLEIGTTAGDVSYDVEFDWSFGAAPGGIVPTSPVAGIVDGVVVIVSDDADRSTLLAIEASTGVTHDLVATDDVILTAAVNAPRREVIYVTADRSTGGLAGAWVLSLEAPKPRPFGALVPPIGTAPDGVRLAAVAEFATWLMVSPDGSTVALFRCVQRDCVLRAARTDDGALIGEHSIDRGWRQPFAIAEGVALMSPTVPDGPERFAEMLDLETGATVPLPVDPWPSRNVLVPADGSEAVLVLQTAGSFVPAPPQPAAAPEVAILELPRMETRAVLSLPFGSLRILPPADWTVGVDLPPGWILAEASRMGEMRVSYVAIDTADGSFVPLPTLGDVPIQG